MKFVLLSLFSLSLFAAKGRDVTKIRPQWDKKKGFDAPESVYYHAATDSLFVSNIVGEGNKKDGKGWISRYSASGELKDDQWVSGIDAPKGMRARSGVLWVSNIDELISIDIKSAKIKKKIKVRGAKFLNDVAIGADGTVYVSDTLGTAIYQFRNGKISVFAKGDHLESPNGLLVDGKNLLVAAWGKTTDWSTKTPGRLYTIDLKTKKKTLITETPLGNLDGLEIAKNGDFLISDWVAGKVFRVTRSGKSRLLYFGMKGAADIGFIPNSQTIIVPRMGENRMTALKAG